MKDARDTWCVQIDVTNMCEQKCANCTHLVKYVKPWKMDLETFRKAVDSLDGYCGQVGIIGGNPALVPQLPEMLGYYQNKVPKKRRAIFISSFGKGNYLEAQIREIFLSEHIYINDHMMDNWHQPVLVASKDIVPDPGERAKLIDECWVADIWSPSIRPSGCFRCEVMGGFDEALNSNLGLPIEKGWWNRPLSDFARQIEAFCGRCGLCVPMERRPDSDCKDDVSFSNTDIATKRPARMEVYDVASYRQDSVANWFPCQYRKGKDKPVGITVSVNYAGSLESILPFNLRHLDSLIVVTSPDDTATLQLCLKHPKIKVIATDLFFRHGAKFNKGAAIELALMMIPRDKWCLIFDSDVCFPADMFLLEALDKECIYGASRVLVNTEEQYSKATSKRNFDLSGLRFEPRDAGFFGMFQLFHPEARALTSRPWYGINYYNASWCDNIFYWHWPESQRKLLHQDLDEKKEVIRLIHLGSRNNWTGEVEGKFPRPETVYSKANEEVPLAVSCDIMMKDIMAEAQRLGISSC
jgi:hypothetical protein